ncbi:zinc-binding dehydrogenase [Apiospora phragmitis]|uniref:Zinc-binding dehydrogenase n=1 Tax=Apiospora phragmitis TaxID=2905665 RepID=A0ABR1W7C3_9PEZI
MPPQNYKFEGWLGHDPASAEGNMVWAEFESKRWRRRTCGSDLHTLSSGWYPAPYPIIVGHEIVREVVRVGVGDRVGVGVGCLADNCEVLPSRPLDLPGPHHNGDKGYGSYATYHRTPGRFTFAIPTGLGSAHAATIMCAGVTMYSPLKRWLGFHPTTPPTSGSGGDSGSSSAKGKKVGIIGLGGLGHYGVLFARAMGADLVLAISRKEAKREEALRLGAHDYLASEEGGKGWFKKYYGQLDLLISTVASAKPRGTLVHVGNPGDGPFAIGPPAAPVTRSLNFAGSCIGSAAETREMLEFAAAQGIQPWVEERPMKDANAALRDLHEGKPRYRYCLVNAVAEAPRL